ncbi:hypothetical protein [Parasitella parasitica]|uniref:F-box domain-containing protein n=1 Tax=Parasitella parasitica TaxID=35722 RepID=A0A0B7NAR0_9FUNG|nr:hypothetical protein [Parasitella parasitica]
MHSTDRITQLPTEITIEVFRHLMKHDIHHPLSLPCKFIPKKRNLGHANSRCLNYNSDDVCLCWQLDLLSAVMVCKSWYLIGLEIIRPPAQVNLQGIQLPWLPLINYSDDSRKYPFRSRLVSLMKESKLANLAFHREVRHLEIDFASFDTIPSRSAQNNNKNIQESVHHATALSEMKELIKLCTQTEKLDIVFDANFEKLVSCTSITFQSTEVAAITDDKNCLIDSCNFLQQTLIQQGRNCQVKRLDFISIDPNRRCPCCVGAKWDQYLFPLITCLTSVETLVLHSVVPSADVLEALNSSNLTKIVFYKSVMMIPDKEEASPRGKASTSINRVPPALWRKIKHVEIYEDIEEATTWNFTKYLTELVDNVHDLESFVLQFDTNEANEKCLSLAQRSSIHNIPIDPNPVSEHYMTDTSSPLYRLQVKCKDTLQRLILVNVPIKM